MTSSGRSSWGEVRAIGNRDGAQVLGHLAPDGSDVKQLPDGLKIGAPQGQDGAAETPVCVLAVLRNVLLPGAVIVTGAR